MVEAIGLERILDQQYSAEPTAPEYLGSALAGYWRFDGDGADASGNGYDLTFYSDGTPATATFAGGMVGQASDIDYHRPSQGEYWRSTGPVPGLQVSGDATFMAWFVPRTTNAVANYTLLGMWDNSQGKAYRLQYSSRSGWEGTCELTVVVENPSAADSSIVTPMIGVVPNKWNLAVAVLDGDALTIYHGVPCGELAQTTITHTGGINVAATEFRVGMRSDGLDVADALVDEVAVWSRALSQEEVEGLLVLGEAGDPLPLDPTCAMLWETDQGLAADLDHNCRVNLLDFAMFVGQWMMCNDPQDPTCND